TNVTEIQTCALPILGNKHVVFLSKRHGGFGCFFCRVADQGNRTEMKNFMTRQIRFIYLICFQKTIGTWIYVKFKASFTVSCIRYKYDPGAYIRGKLHLVLLYLVTFQCFLQKSAYNVFTDF